MSPLFQKVDCIRIPVPDLEEGLTYYRDRLGHKLIWRTATAAGLSTGEGPAEIVVHTEDHGFEVDIKVESADRAAELFEATGGRIIHGPFDIRIGRCVVVADPWGNELVLLDTCKGLLATDAEGNVIDSECSP
jgi:predicted enzyme related to lactoylglutathione lyase